MNPRTNQECQLQSKKIEQRWLPVLPECETSTLSWIRRHLLQSTLLYILYISIAIIIILTEESWSQKTLQCNCPFNSNDWIIYPDTAHGIPDCFATSSVNVQGMLVCAHGINFFFKSGQNGRKCFTCLALAKPSLERCMETYAGDSLLNDSMAQELEQKLDYQIHHYNVCVQNMEHVLGGNIKEGEVLTFKVGWLGNPPKLYFGDGITLRLKGRSAKLWGIINVYFRNDHGKRDGVSTSMSAYGESGNSKRQ